MIRFKHKGDSSKLIRFLERAKEAVHLGNLDKPGREGVAAFSSVMPVDSGEMVVSQYYKTINKNNIVTILFHNPNVQDEVPIAIILQYGYGTRDRGWVRGRGYINPAIQPIFDQTAGYVWKEVTWL